MPGGVREVSREVPAASLVRLGAGMCGPLPSHVTPVREGEGGGRLRLSGSKKAAHAG